MKTINLTQGMIAMVDDADYETLSQFKWYAKKSLHTHYAVRNISENLKQRRVWMHRIVMNASDKTILVDHKDGNGLNNQKNNLRFASHSQNQVNRVACGVSIYLGVKKSGNSWVARTSKNGKRFHLGSFPSEIEAAKAYNLKAVELHGEFAKLNQI